ncbi:MAG: CBS domain-containing protein [Planctomycetaceae bacterium]|nr:CBS domain-containing protein [Planctomycetaceae bacterium]
MPTVRDILARKGNHVLTIGPQATILDAACLMNEHKVGCLLVTHNDEIAGILTERDLLERVVAQCRQPDTMAVREAMTTDVLYCRPHTELDEVRSMMKEYRLRHLPVADLQGVLHGMISIGDLNAWEVQSHEATITVLTEYIHGRV